MPSQVLVVDDDPRVRRLIAKTFLESGYYVRVAGSAEEAWQEFEQGEPDLVLLDVMMPGGNGLDLCQRVRQRSSVPIIMLTGLRNETDIIAGLQAGADDYVTKPFSPRELVARVEANLRRRALDHAPSGPGKIVLHEGRFEVDFNTRSARIGEREQPLTRREFAILGYLAQHAGRVVPHDELIQHVWGTSDPGRLADLRTYVKLIRRKIEPVPSHPRYLQARAGTGYLIPKI